MRNPETITRNIAARFEENFGRQLTGAERAAVKSASCESLRKFSGLKVRAFVTENIGLSNALCRFEDIASGKDTDIRRAVHKEVAECLLEYAGRIGTRIGKQAIAFVREWRDGDEGENLFVPADNPNANNVRKWRREHREAANEHMRKWRATNR